MSFSIVTDTSANLQSKHIKDNDITIIPFSYYMDGVEAVCLEAEEFDSAGFYQKMRDNVRVTTSQINPQRYIEHMEPLLKEGKDILFVGMSSGISGAYSSSVIAVTQLREEYPDRKIYTVDSLGASLGEGLVVFKAIECRAKGMTIEETSEFLLKFRHNICQIFTVDDLKYLQMGGRISNATAFTGNLLNIKPLLKGNENGQIVTFGKTRGRKRTIDAILKKYEELSAHHDGMLVGISHADCADDAGYVADMVNKINPPKEIIIVEHEPATGSYLGPGALALFFEGTEGSRLK